MKLYFVIITALISCVTYGSPQFEACAFDAKILEKAIISEGKHSVKLFPVSRVRFTHKLWSDSSWVCPKIGVSFSKSIYISESTKQTIDMNVGNVVRLVIEYVDGIYDHQTGDAYDTEELRLFKDGGYALVISKQANE